jgi:hypothetical protein
MKAIDQFLIMRYTKRIKKPEKLKRKQSQYIKKVLVICELLCLAGLIFL